MWAVLAILRTSVRRCYLLYLLSRRPLPKLHVRSILRLSVRFFFFFPVFYFFNHLVFSETRPPCCCISPAAGCLMLLPPRCLLQALIRCGMLKKSGRSCKSKRTVVQTTNKYHNVLCVSLQEDRCIITAFFHPPFCLLLPLLLPTPLTPTPPSSPSPLLIPGPHACE